MDELTPRKIDMMNELNEKEFTKMDVIARTEKPPKATQPPNYFDAIGKKRTFWDSVPDVIVCGSKSKSTQTMIIRLLIMTFVVSVIGLYVFWGTNFINSLIIAGLVLKNGTLSYAMWAQPTVKPRLKLYLFNYTNVEEFENDPFELRLKVEEVGPYVYEENTERVNAVFNQDGTEVTYQEKHVYRFLPDESGKNREQDRVIVPNIPVLTAMNKIRNTYPFTRFTYNQIFRRYRTKEFLNLSVKDFIWGYKDELVTLAHLFAPAKEEIPEEFGLMMLRKGTSRDRVTIRTGKSSLNDIGVITRLNDDDHMHVWNGNECNRVDGTDGALFPLDAIHNLEPIAVFNRGVCRKIPFVYNETIVADLNNDPSMLMPMVRYKLSPHFFQSGQTNPDNMCFCAKDLTCSPDGLFSTKLCTRGAPMYISNPHFYGANRSAFITVDGNFTYDPKLHESYLDLHPNLAFPLQGKSRMQINIEAQQLNAIDVFGNFVEPVVLPVSWFEMAIENLPMEFLDLIYLMTFTVATIQTVLRFACLIGATISFSFLLAWWYARKC